MRLFAVAIIAVWSLTGCSGAPERPAPVFNATTLSARPVRTPSAICHDGTPSLSRSRQGTCSRHGGVREWR